MTLHGTLKGTVVWLVIGIGVGMLAVSQDNRITGLIAIGWIMLAVFSYFEYRKTAG